MTHFKNFITSLDKDLILDKCVELHYEGDFNPTPSVEEMIDCKSVYSILYDKLISFGEWTWFRKKYDLHFRYADGVGDEEPYIDVCLWNKNYEEYDTTLKPWGGDSKKKDDAPDGYVNINYENHNRYMAMSFMPWRILVNLEMTFADDIQTDIDSGKISKEDLCAEALFEISFYGYTESSYIGMKNELKDRMDEIKTGDGQFLDIDDAFKEIKDYIEDRSESKKINDGTGMTIKICPEAVEDIKEIISQENDIDNG